MNNLQKQPKQSIFKASGIIAIAILASLVLGSIGALAEVYLSQFGSSGDGNGQFDSPWGITIDASGNIYVVDTLNSRIQKFNSAGIYQSQFGSIGSGDGQFLYPHTMAIDASGNIYVLDTYNNRIQKFNSAGVYQSQFGSYGTGDGQFNYAAGITLDASGNIYVADTYNNRVQKFNSAGVYQSQFGSLGIGDGEFQSPWGITIDASGNIYVVDATNHRVQKFNSTGVYQSQFGSFGSGNGQFYDPVEIAIDASGNIYVTDGNNNRVQKFNSSGVYQSQFGTFGTGDGQFNVPAGIAINVSGNIYVSDTNNDRVQIFAAPATAPSAPQNLVATGNDGNVTLTWDAPSSDGGSAITGYVVEYSTDNFATAALACGDASCTDATTGATVPSLTNGTPYYFRVLATNAIGASIASNTATATPSGSGGGGSSGTQNITCNFSGTTTITAPALGVGDAVTFESRTTNFYNDATHAPLDVGQSLPVEVTDSRGYDPGLNDCRGPGPGQTADHTFQLQIQSSGLDGPGGSNLRLQLGTPLTDADLSSSSVPATATDVAHVSGLTNTSIFTAQNLIIFDETFSSSILATLTGNDLEVIRPAGTISPGLYSGEITLSLLNF